jgi:hypothetical protein
MFVPKTLDDLKRIVQERLEETIQLEFKRELPPSGKNDDLAKDLAAIANAQGGVIAYGIEQDEAGRAKALHPFPICGAAERVTLVAQTLDEPLTLSNIDTILAEDSEENGFVVVEIQKSERAPHLFKGIALGRTAKGNAPLTRRQVGELFARSPGFAEEFGLTIGRPGRVIARLDSEAYQETDSSGRLRTRRRYRLLFQNDGDSDVRDVEWEWVSEGDPNTFPKVFQDPFPLPVFQAGLQLPVTIHASISAPTDLKVRTRWRSSDGKLHEHLWPTTW